MKYLFINSVVDYGSTGKIVRQLANSLLTDGHEVLIAYGRNQSDNDKNTYYFGDKYSSGIHLLFSRFLGRHGLHSTRKTKELINTIEEFNPDCIHLHNLHGYYLNVRLLFSYLAKRKNTKVIWTLHDCWSVSGSSAYFSFKGCKVWEDGCVVCNDTNEYPRSSCIKRQRKNFKWKKKSFTSLTNMKIITPSVWLKELIETTFLQKYDVTSIYNGLDLSVFKPQRTDIRSENIVLLGVSNIWEERKGLSDFIQLREILPSSIEMVLLGLSPKQIETLPKGIKGITRTNSVQELVEIYSNSDLYLNFSVEETMGMTTIEAIACGTPAYVYDQTAVPEIVNNKVGKIFKAHDLMSVKNAILEYTSEDFNRETLVSYAKTFSERNMIDNYAKEYYINE